jgi:hypothetical protein
MAGEYTVHLKSATGKFIFVQPLSLSAERGADAGGSPRESEGIFILTLRVSQSIPNSAFLTRFGYSIQVREE